MSLLFGIPLYTSTSGLGPCTGNPISDLNSGLQNTSVWTFGSTVLVIIWPYKTTSVFAGYEHQTGNPTSDSDSVPQNTPIPQLWRIYINIGYFSFFDLDQFGAPTYMVA